MAITIDNTEIRITTNTYSIEDIYNYVQTTNKASHMKKLGNAYEIKNDLRIESGSIADSNISLTILGDKFQIHKSASFTLGLRRDDLSTYEGGYLSIPNVLNAYGFGNTNKSNSGNLFLYGSVIDIYGFWGFFNSDTNGNVNHVEVIDCQVNGFGRIEGPDSILKNINFRKSHGKFGILSPKGTIDILENLSSLESQADDLNNVSIYHNPTFAGNLTILGGIYDGYQDLAYTEDTAGTWELKFIDSDIRNGYNIKRESNNVNLTHDYTFSPIIYDVLGNAKSGVRVIIKDINNLEVFNNVTNPQGKIDTFLNYFTLNKDNTSYYSTPHTIQIIKDDIDIIYTININKPLINNPLFLVASGGVSTGSNGCADSQDMLNTLESRLNTKLNLMESGIRQLISNVVDEVNENETYFKETGFTVMM